MRNLPVSLGVVVAITLSMEDTENSTLMIPSTSQPTDMSDMSLAIHVSFESCKHVGVYLRRDFSRVHGQHAGAATLSLQFSSHVLIHDGQWLQLQQTMS